MALSLFPISDPDIFFSLQTGRLITQGEFPWGSDPYGIAQGEEIRIGLQLAQEDLAQLLGASRQRVNQELKGFEREGAVRVEPTRLVVLSRDKLFAAAGGANP